MRDASEDHFASSTDSNEGVIKLFVRIARCFARPTNKTCLFYALALRARRRMSLLILKRKERKGVSIQMQTGKKRFQTENLILRLLSSFFLSCGPSLMHVNKISFFFCFKGQRVDLAPQHQTHKSPELTNKQINFEAVKKFGPTCSTFQLEYHKYYFCKTAF